MEQEENQIVIKQEKNQIYQFFFLNIFYKTDKTLNFISFPIKIK